MDEKIHILAEKRQGKGVSEVMDDFKSNNNEDPFKSDDYRIWRDHLDLRLNNIEEKLSLFNGALQSVVMSTALIETNIKENSND